MHELVRHAAAMRGLARDLVGEHAADDVMQETAVEALRAPPRRPVSLGGWLASVVRRLASRHRRSERRRREREERVARHEVAPPDSTVEDRDLLRRLTAAVMALPEPYQDAVLRRYLRERSPPEIARDTGVPLATVKTRLQRGLALLRQRLAREGADWRPALCTAFGLEPALALAGITPVGVFIMGTGAKLGLAGVALALAVALWWGTDREPPPATARAATQPDAGGMVAAANGAATDNEREEVTSAGAAKEVERRTVVRGRCVDEGGRPLPRCEVELRGRKVLERTGPDLRHEYGEWLVAHPDRVFRDVTAVTDAAGRFEFTIDHIPLAYQLRLRRDVPDHLVRIGALQPGEARDLGDIVLPVVCELHGRVVDSNGTAVIGLARVMETRWTKDAVQTVAHVSEAKAAADGTFTAHAVAGDYEVGVDGREVVRGKAVTVPSACTQLDLEVVVAVVGPENTISGVVVDRDNQPVVGIRVQSVPVRQVTTSDGTGRFTIFSSRTGASGQAMLWANGMTDELVVPWGTHDLRLVVARESVLRRDVELHVTASGGVPVTDFAVHGLNPRFPSGLEAEGTSALGGRHAGGVVVLHDIATWAMRVMVEPDRADLWMATVSLPEGTGPQQIEVNLPAAASRLLRIVRDDGAPADGVVVEQLIAGSHELSLTSRASPLETWRRGNGYESLLLQRSATDARGKLTMRGPEGGAIALRLPGPPALLVPEVRFDTDEPLVLTLPLVPTLPRARLEGRLGPAALVRELRGALGWPADGPVAQADSRSQIGFRLQRGAAQDAECVPLADAVPVMVAGDGSFAIEGVLPGRWHLMFAGADDYGRSVPGVAEVVSEVDMRAGETTRVVVDLADRLTGELEGQVLLNGVPMTGEGGQNLIVVARREGERSHRCGGMDTRLDAEGRFRLRMREGRARVLLSAMMWQPGFGLWNVWSSREEVFVPKGGKVSQVFHVDRSRVRLRIVGGDGKPLPDVAVLLRGDDGRLQQTTTSAADGWLATEAELHPFTVQVLPRSFTRTAGQIQDWITDRVLWSLPRADPFAGSWLTLGRVTPKAGETVELELKLPPEWYR